MRSPLPTLGSSILPPKHPIGKNSTKKFVVLNVFQHRQTSSFRRIQVLLVALLMKISLKIAIIISLKDFSTGFTPRKKFLFVAVLVVDLVPLCLEVTFLYQFSTVVAFEALWVVAVPFRGLDPLPFNHLPTAVTENASELETGRATGLSFDLDEFPFYSKIKIRIN